MSKSIITASVLLVALFLAGCSSHARNSGTSSPSPHSSSASASPCKGNMVCTGWYTGFIDWNTSNHKNELWASVKFDSVTRAYQMKLVYYSNQTQHNTTVTGYFNGTFLYNETSRSIGYTLLSKNSPDFPSIGNYTWTNEFQSSRYVVMNCLVEHVNLTFPLHFHDDDLAYPVGYFKGRRNINGIVENVAVRSNANNTISYFVYARSGNTSANWFFFMQRPIGFTFSDNTYNIDWNTAVRNTTSAYHDAFLNLGPRLTADMDKNELYFFSHGNRITLTEDTTPMIPLNPSKEYKTVQPALYQSENPVWNETTNTFASYSLQFYKNSSTATFTAIEFAPNRQQGSANVSYKIHADGSLTLKGLEPYDEVIQKVLIGRQAKFVIVDNKTISLVFVKPIGGRTNFTLIVEAPNFCTAGVVCIRYYDSGDVQLVQPTTNAHIGLRIINNNTLHFIFETTRNTAQDGSVSAFFLPYTVNIDGKASIEWNKTRVYPVARERFDLARKSNITYDFAAYEFHIDIEIDEHKYYITAPMAK